jgi:uncharacterized protein YukE
MEDNNNNLGDFLRKKLDNSDEPVGRWGKPDKEVKASVLEQITTIPLATQKGSYAKFIYLGIAALLVLTTGGYLWNLYQQNQDLHNTLVAQSNQTSQLENQLNGLNQKYETTTTKLNQQTQQLVKALQETETEIAQLKNTLLNERSGHQKTKIRTKAHLEAIAQLEKEKQSLLVKIEQGENGNFNGDSTIADGVSDRSNSGVAVIQYLADVLRDLPVILQQPWASPNESTKNQLIIPTDQLFKKAHQRFRIGYEFSPLEFELEADRSFARQRSPHRRLASKKTFAAAHGLLLAYSPKGNWWIRTGFRFASFDVKGRNTVVLAYDPTNEEMRPGFRTNELSMSINTPYAETNSSFSISIPDDTELNEDDLLEIDIIEIQSIQVWQIPIGVEYIQGKNKLQWLWQGGLQFNQIVFGGYSFEATASSRRQFIGVERGRIESRAKDSKRFMSAYAGLGCNYHLAGHWHAKAAFTYNYNFLNNRTSDFSNATKRGTAFNLGLAYQF